MKKFKENLFFLNILRVLNFNGALIKICMKIDVIYTCIFEFYDKLTMSEKGTNTGRQSQVSAWPEER